MKKYLFILFKCLVTIINAQNITIQKKCGTVAPSKEWNDWFNKKVTEFKQAHSDLKQQSPNYTIPVIFHVIYGGESEGTFPNISQAQINSQIAILNNDYGGTGLNVNNFASTAFSSSVIANCSINFCLAERDPLGNVLSQKGIERISYVNNTWSNPASFNSISTFQNFMDATVKPNTIWDPTRYFNIWISDVSLSTGLLGYATSPSGTSLPGITSSVGTATSDGVWCYSKSIGDVGSLLSPYDKGRTLTHETGHWLGLLHIWGDSNCGDDFCNDTPTQQQANLGCKTYPNVSCTNGPEGDMFMNFMDYSDDVCMYMFTNDQSTRIQTAMTNCPFRVDLTANSATLCTSSSIGVKENSTLNTSINLFPNPLSGDLSLSTNLPNSQNLDVIIFNLLGQVIYSNKLPNIQQKTIKIDLNDKKQGIYFVELSNGQEKIIKKIIIGK